MSDPVQREGFLAAQPGRQHEPEQRFEPVAPNGIQEPVRVVRGEVGGVLTFDGRPLDDSRGVPTKEPVAYGHVQRSP
jgi:hypothetical protein